MLSLRLKEAKDGIREFVVLGLTQECLKIGRHEVQLGKVLSHANENCVGNTTNSRERMRLYGVCGLKVEYTAKGDKFLQEQILPLLVNFLPHSITSETQTINLGWWRIKRDFSFR